MTDLESFIATYKQFGIDVKTLEFLGQTFVFLNFSENDIESTNSNKFYGNMFSEIVFDKKGKFKRQIFTERDTN